MAKTTADGAIQTGADALEAVIAEAQVKSQSLIDQRDALVEQRNALNVQINKLNQQITEAEGQDATKARQVRNLLEVINSPQGAQILQRLGVRPF